MNRWMWPAAVAALMVGAAAAPVARHDYMPMHRDGERELFIDAWDNASRRPAPDGYALELVRIEWQSYADDNGDVRKRRRTLVSTAVVNCDWRTVRAAPEDRPDEVGEAPYFSVGWTGGMLALRGSCLNLGIDKDQPRFDTLVGLEGYADRRMLPPMMRRNTPDPTLPIPAAPPGRELGLRFAPVATDATYGHVAFLDAKPSRRGDEVYAYVLTVLGPKSQATAYSRVLREVVFDCRKREYTAVGELFWNRVRSKAVKQANEVLAAHMHWPATGQMAQVLDAACSKAPKGPWLPDIQAAEAYVDSRG